MRIEKKAWPESFERVSNGTRRLELRLADFSCKAGDILVFREWDPKKKDYTGRKVEKEVKNVNRFKITDFYKKDDIEKYGLQIIEI
jgi:ASC-1-like (ASCH) protein